MIMRKVRKKAGMQSPQPVARERRWGRREEFDKEKLAQTVSRSGTPFAMARDIARDDKALKKKRSGSEAEIDARTVRDMIVEEQ
jgi:hypothetical protein